MGDKDVADPRGSSYVPVDPILGRKKAEGSQQRPQDHQTTASRHHGTARFTPVVDMPGFHQLTAWTAAPSRPLRAVRREAGVGCAGQTVPKGTTTSSAPAGRSWWPAAKTGDGSTRGSRHANPFGSPASEVASWAMAEVEQDQCPEASGAASRSQASGATSRSRFGSRHLAPHVSRGRVGPSPEHVREPSGADLATLSFSHFLTFSPRHLVTLSPCHLITRSGVLVRCPARCCAVMQGGIWSPCHLAT